MNRYFELKTPVTPYKFKEFKKFIKQKEKNKKIFDKFSISKMTVEERLARGNG